MATQVGIRELRDHLSRYLEQVKAGERITVTEHGRPIAELVRFGLSPTLQRLIAEGRATAPTAEFDPTRRLKPIKVEGGVSRFLDDVR